MGFYVCHFKGSPDQCSIARNFIIEFNFKCLTRLAADNSKFWLIIIIIILITKSKNADFKEEGK